MAGQAAGQSERFDSAGNALGDDAWFFNGAASRQIGLTGGVYSYQSNPGDVQQNSSIEYLNSAGEVAGDSTRYGNFGTDIGNDTWFFNGASTVQIGLTGNGYTYTDSNGVHQTSTIEGMNSSGSVVGFSDEYPGGFYSAGPAVAPWIYNPTTAVTTPLELTSSPDVQFSSDDILSINDAGDIYGTYDLYDGTTDEGIRAFFWTPSDGFSDLGSLVAGGLDEQGWQYLEFGNPFGGTINGYSEFFTGSGLLNGQTLAFDRDNASMPYLMVEEVPEPSSLAGGLLVAGLLLLGRRVPEPATLSLMAGTLVVMMGRTRRVRK